MRVFLCTPTVPTYTAYVWSLYPSHRFRYISADVAISVNNDKVGFLKIILDLHSRKKCTPFVCLFIIIMIWNLFRVKSIAIRRAVARLYRQYIFIVTINDLKRMYYIILVL